MNAVALILASREKSRETRELIVKYVAECAIGGVAGSAARQLTSNRSVETEQLVNNNRLHWTT